MTELRFPAALQMITKGNPWLVIGALGGLVALIAVSHSTAGIRSSI